ncbi:hypothetical protein ONZ51_g2534 [Trametes cubensis]|uniref:Uncharacterized protein n=1 Tax=Trametes cubensis TaxID=1111947 RepID=A0AAD7XED8_9APHY|nr:hypothetical protein ONZ51_g2534 [Trametes cubensis]
MHHTSTAFYPAHAPEQWATGGELMTTNQRAALDSAAAHVGIDIPFLQPEDANGQRVTKSEASPLSPICGKSVHPSAALDRMGASARMSYQAPASMASLLISRLREEKKNVRSSAEEKRMAFQDAVGSVRRELPAPGED